MAGSGSNGTAATGRAKAGTMPNAFSKSRSRATPRTPSYCPVRSDPMAATARDVDSTVQPLSRAAAQIVAIPQPAPQVRGTPVATRAAGPESGQSGRSNSRRPDAPTASRLRQNSDTTVTIVQPTASPPAPALRTRVRACSRKPAADRTSPGMPSARHEATRSAAIARSRSRTCRGAGQASRSPVGGAAGSGEADFCTFYLQNDPEPPARRSGANTR